MKYGKHSPEENARLQNWAPGHTGKCWSNSSNGSLPIHDILDLGSFTLLFRQPVAGLQIRYHSTNEWKWVKPLDASITVNACDALQLLTAGYVKSTIHRYVDNPLHSIRSMISLITFNRFRVHVPPKDQQHVDRLGLLYFSRCLQTSFV